MWPTWFSRFQSRRNTSEDGLGEIGFESTFPVASEVPNHRSRTLAMNLEHARICSTSKCQRLRSVGIESVGDLAYCNLKDVAMKLRLGRKGLMQLRQYRRAARLAASIPTLTACDALLLVSIHRRTMLAIAGESAPTLYRDLCRFADSSEGRRVLRGRSLPSMRRVKRWIEFSVTT
ncbi:MAG: DUF4332 domain-containing protein [Planctomycetota bacterium]